jgi:hypothetical protein
MASKKVTSGWLVIDDLTGGRNGVDPPQLIRDIETADAVNVDLYRTRFAHKRGGGSNLSLTFSAGGPFGGAINGLFRHVPASNQALAELWAVDSFNVFGRLAGGTTWTAPTFKDAMTGAGYDVDGASINGKFMLAYQSATARHHAWDGSTVRRTGLVQSGGNAVADTGGGAYAAILRYYRQRWTVQSGGITIRRSEPSATPTPFTPSGAGTAARLTQAGPPGEGETHWEVEASLDNATFYRIATVVVGTTTYDDSAATTTYNTNPLSAVTGTYTTQKPYKFIAVDQNRQLGFGSWTSTDKQSRVEFSAVIGSLDVGDEERVDTTTNYYVDLDESDSGNATGIAGPVLGSFFAFKLREIAQLTPTGQTSQPYSVKFISKSVGAISDRSIVVAEDDSGNPCLYWMSLRGPYRWGVGGLQYIGRGIEDLIIGSTETMWTLNILNKTAHGVFYQDKRQVWWFVLSTSSSGLFHTTVIVFDIIHQAWTRYTGVNDSVLAAPLIQRQQCSVMFSNTIGASMSVDLKPYGGFNELALTPIITKWDTGASDLSPTGTAGIQAFITTKAYEPGGPGFFGQCGDAMLTAAAAAGVTITDTVTPDFGAAIPKTGTCLLTAAGAETRVTKRLEDSTLGGFQFYQHTIGDAAANTSAWTLDRLVVPVLQKEKATA